MVSEKVQLDFGSDFDDSNYKSCFARSVAVNSQFKQSQCPKLHHLDRSVGGFAEYNSKKSEFTTANAFQKLEISSNDFDISSKVDY